MSKQQRFELSKDLSLNQNGSQRLDTATLANRKEVPEIHGKRLVVTTDLD